MKVLELFSGTGSFSNVAREREHEVFTVDNNNIFQSDLCIDIFDLSSEEIINKFGHPDIIWASPPCTKFSILRVSKNWEKNGDKYIPKNEETIKSIELVKKTLKLIKELKPKYYFIENPRAMLRKQDFMPNDKRKTVTYCKYGLPYQKATDIWTNCDKWIPRTICKANDPCHVRSPRGSTTGIQGFNSEYRKNRNPLHPLDFSYITNNNGKNRSILRAVVPRELCLEIIKSCEEQIK